MKKMVLFFMMIVGVAVSAQAQMAGTSVKVDRNVYEKDNRTMQNVWVHNVISGELGCGFYDVYHVSGLKYYVLNNWGFQVGGKYSYNDIPDSGGPSYREAYYLFLLGTNKRIMNDGYLCLSAGYGKYHNNLLYTDHAEYSLELSFIYVTQKKLSLSAGIQWDTDDTCFTVGLGFDFFRKVGK